jgi:multiple sugar transport system substrate-binding protein
VVDGRIYAIPLDTHPFVMYYNTDVCRTIGLLDSTGHLAPISGADDLIAAWTEAKKATGTWGLVLDGFGVSPWRLWWTLYRQLDGQFFGADGTTLVIDDAKALQALDFMRRLSVVDRVAPGQMYLDGAIALFGSGKAGFLFNGDWEVTTFQTQKTPFSMAPFPDVFGTTGRTQADCHTFVLPHQRNRDPAGTRAALDYVAHMLKNSLDWAAGGHVPAYLPVAQGAEFLALEPQSRYRQVAKNAQLDPIAWFSGSASELENQAGAAFGAVQAGAATPEQGLAQFKTAITRLLDTPAPV